MLSKISAELILINALSPNLFSCPQTYFPFIHSRICLFNQHRFKWNLNGTFQKVVTQTKFSLLMEDLTCGIMFSFHI